MQPLHRISSAVASQKSISRPLSSIFPRLELENLMHLKDEREAVFLTSPLAVILKNKGKLYSSCSEKGTTAGLAAYP
jgi:hypothetical protein